PAAVGAPRVAPGSTRTTQRVAAATSRWGTFQPERLTTGVAPRSEDELYVAVSVWDSPGQRVMSSSLHETGRTSLSPGSSAPAAVPRRTSARMKKGAAGAVVAGTFGRSTALATPWLGSARSLATWLSRRLPRRSCTLASTERPDWAAPVRLASVTVPLS